MRLLPKDPEDAAFFLAALCAAALMGVTFGLGQINWDSFFPAALDPPPTPTSIVAERTPSP